MISELKVVRLHRLDNNSKTKAFADIAIGDYIVKGLTVREGKEGLFLGMPQDKGKDGKWYNSFYPVTPEAKDELLGVVLTAYQSE
ncbi:MAG: SpoVG family protein [Candidatus Omnitrophica bacterium]|nr:SpoVG family protein [Candidatus Omnitrophota bacterium]MBU1905815.1 SpoVG family protein [Candidatus Omnitrophota bacterium]